MDMRIKGRVWKLDHNVDTDAIAPWKTISSGWEERRSQILQFRPEFVDQVQSGDIIVAGRNWGCGSRREQAAENIKLVGVAAVVAESFGRIYFRYSIAIALPSVICSGIHNAFEEADEMDLDLATCQIRNLTRGSELKGQTYTKDMLNILQKGGLMNVLKERLNNNSGV